MVSKTRDRLIEVARQLFVNKGVENTTMNDIAAASDKGRRTIYTYFKNKREIYNAVVESESNAIIGRLRQIVDSDLDPIEKLKKYLKKRFEVISATNPQAKTPYDRYRALFSRDARKVEKIYDMARQKEQDLFAELLNKGVESGFFDESQAKRLPAVMTLILLTTDHVKMNTFSMDDYDLEVLTDKVVDFVTTGIVRTKQPLIII